MEKSLLRVLRTVAPGTAFRKGLENILQAQTGALIFVLEDNQYLSIVEGGFAVNAAFTPANLYELAKMDGAIVLSRDLKQILFANAQLIPDLNIPSVETGIRHRTAERVALQTNSLVISVSKRRKIITLYKGSLHYVLRNPGLVLAEANQAVQTLEKYKSVLNRTVGKLGLLEFESSSSLFDAVQVIQRVEMVRRVVKELEGYISELGSEGRLITMQMEELTVNVEQEGLLVIRDYGTLQEGKTAKDVMDIIASWPSEDLLDLVRIGRALGFSGSNEMLDQPVYPKGYRLLDKIPRLPYVVTQNLVNHFHFLPNILAASLEDLDAVEGIGESRARSIKEGLERYKAHLNNGRYSW